MNIGSRRILTSEEVQKFATAMQAVNWTNDAERRAVGETIIKELKEVIEKDNIIQILQPDVQTFLPGQSVEFIARKGMKAYVHEPGSYAPRSTVVQRKVTLATEMVSVAPEMEINQLRAGRYGSIQDLKNMALAELLGRKYGILWSTLVGSITDADSNYWTAVGATHSAVKAAVDSGLNYVLDLQDNDAVAIIGRLNALQALANASVYTSDQQKNQVESQKMIQSYKGIPVVALKQYTDGWGTEVITENEIIILGKNTVKMGYDIPLDFMDEIDVDTLMWHMHIYESYGVAIFDGFKNARIHLT